MRYQHPLSGLVGDSASRAGSPSLQNTFLRAQGAPGWLQLPEIVWAMVEPASSPSIILISQRWQPGSPWLHGQRAGATRRETVRRHHSDKPRHKQKQQPSSFGTSKHHDEIYVAAEPKWVLGGWGQPWQGDRGRRGCPRAGLPTQTCGSDKVSCGTQMGCRQGAKQFALHCDGHNMIKTRQGRAPRPWALCAHGVPKHDIKL